MTNPGSRDLSPWSELGPSLLRICDREGRCAFVSQGWRDFAGASGDEGEGLGDGWWDALHPDDREESRRLFSEALLRQESVVLEYRLRRADGVYRWMLDSSEARFDGEGTFEGFVSVQIDIHSRKLAEFARKESEEIMRRALDAAKLGTWRIDPGTMQVYFDERYRNILGIVGDSVEYGSIIARVPPEERAWVESSVAAATRPVDPEPYSIEHRLLHPDGTYHWIAANGRATFEGPERRLASFSGTVADITERRRAEEAQRRNSEALAELIARCPLGIYTVDSDFRVAHVSEGAMPAFRNVQPVIGRDFAEVMNTLWPPEFADEAIRIFRRTLETGEPYVSPGLIEKRKDIGAIESYEWQTTRVTLSDGKPGVVCYFFDSTRLQQANLALKETRSRLESTLVAGEVATWEYDVVNDRIYIDADRAEAMFGVTPEDAAGGKLDAYLRRIHAADRERVREAIQRALHAGDRYEHEYRIEVPARPTRWILARGRVERDPSGQPIRLPGVAMDISAQRRAEADLSDTRKRWKLALESAEMGTWTIDPERNELDGDERFRLLFRGTTKPISYEQAFEAIHPDDRQRIRDAVAAAIDPEDPQPYTEEYRVVHEDGTALWLMARGRANFEEEGGARRLVSFDGTVSDITERKAAEKALIEADRRKTEFLATLAHELRNPLGPIRTGLELIRIAGEDREMVEEVRTTMETQTKQLVRLVDDLLDVSRITSGKFSLKLETVELATIARNAVAATRAIIEDEGHGLAVEFPTSPVYLRGDATRLTQIVSNLLTNAARYTPKGGRIDLSVETRGAEALVKVRDTGIGIGPEMIDRIFEMFAQADTASERSRGGLGIGLTLVKRLAEMHGGSVEVRSEGEGKGSEFLVRLPVLNDLESDVSFPSKAVQLAPSRKVLVVDDNKTAADMLSMMVALLGNEVRTAYDGVQGFDAAAEFLPDMVLMDLGMPKLNGYDAARMIRKHAWGKSMLLVALTGWGQESDKSRTKDAGFDHHLVKPAEPSALENLLATVGARSDSAPS